MYFLFKLFFSLLASTHLFSSVTRDLPYPKVITANEIAKQIYFVNHQLYLKNQLIQAKGKGTNKKSILILKRLPGKKVLSFSLNRYFNNNYSDGIIKSKDMLIFNSGKIKGLGVLMKEYVDERKSIEVAMYFPALRKTRRMAEPTKGSTYGAADIAFLEEIKTRHLGEEINELIETKKMTFHFNNFDLEASEINKQTRQLPQHSVSKTLDVYTLKVTPRIKTWYDYRIDYTDTEHFTVHRTLFFKDSKIIKTVDRRWKMVEGFDDPRASMWHYWYTIDESTMQSVYYIPPEIIKNNDENIKESFWRDSTLRKIKR